MAERQEWHFQSEDGTADIAAATTWSGQTFTLGSVGPNLTFPIESIDIRIKRTLNPGVLNIEIREVSEASSLPNANVIASGTIAEASVTVADTWVNGVLTSQGTCQAGKAYAIIFNAPGADATNKYHLATDTSGPTYAGGSVVESTDSGVTFAANAAAECGFQANGGSYEGTLCTLADAVNKAGTNANASAIKEVLVSDWVKQAEGKINAVTRYDWIAKYSSLTDQVKFLLNKVASSEAAINIIAYDMAGYTAATAEAETMINIYREDVLTGLSLLRDQEVRKFIVGDT